MSGTLRRIEQLTQQGKTQVLGAIIIDDIDAGAKKYIAHHTMEFSKRVGNVCVHIDPGTARSQYVRELLEQNFEVRFALQPNRSRDKERKSYTVYLDEKSRDIITNSDPDTVEDILKKEIEILNDIGFNLKYAGQYVPPATK